MKVQVIGGGRLGHTAESVEYVAVKKSLENFLSFLGDKQTLCGLKNHRRVNSI